MRAFAHSFARFATTPLIRQGQGGLGIPEVFGGEFWRFYSNADPTDRVAIGEDEAARMLEGHSREKLFEPPADE